MLHGSHNAIQLTNCRLRLLLISFWLPHRTSMLPIYGSCLSINCKATREFNGLSFSGLRLSSGDSDWRRVVDIGDVECWMLFECTLLLLSLYDVRISGCQRGDLATDLPDDRHEPKHIRITSRKLPLHYGGQVKLRLECSVYTLSLARALA